MTGRRHAIRCAAALLAAALLATGCPSSRQSTVTPGAHCLKAGVRAKTGNGTRMVCIRTKKDRALRWRRE